MDFPAMRLREAVEAFIYAAHGECLPLRASLTHGGLALFSANRPTRSFSDFRIDFAAEKERHSKDVEPEPERHHGARLP
jgi:hypothetical protein